VREQVVPLVVKCDHRSVVRFHQICAHRAHYETASEWIASYRAMSFRVRRIRTANQRLPLDCLEKRNQGEQTQQWHMFRIVRLKVSNRIRWLKWDSVKSSFIITKQGDRLWNTYLKNASFNARLTHASLNTTTCNK